MESTLPLTFYVAVDAPGRGMLLMKCLNCRIAALGLLAASLSLRSLAQMPPPSTAPAVPPVRITIDTTEAPQLTDWAEKTLKPVLETWYPKIVAELPSTGFTAPTEFHIVFTNKFKGVAATWGTHIEANADWITKELNGQAVGAIIHEEVHVVQAPFGSKGPHPIPQWLLEGSADYIRWFQFEPQHPRIPQKSGKYDASYRPTAAFLNWVADTYDKSIVTQMNAANRAGTYSDDLWKQYTGKSVEVLGAEWKETLAK